MTLRAVVFATIAVLLSSCSTISRQERVDANRQQWGPSGPPPSAGAMCGTYWAKTALPEGGLAARSLWHLNGHYTQKSSPGVCR